VTPDAIATVARALSKARRVLVVTGAGISAESGLPTYRGVGGLYDSGDTQDGVPIEVALSGPMLKQNPALTWKYLGQIEAACRGAKHNGAHEILARWEQRFDGFTVLTQNVDGFHQSAGAKNVIAIHGDLHDLECLKCGASRRVEDYAGLELPPRCPKCAGAERPRVVLFGEMLPLREVARLQEVLSGGLDVVLSIGTTSVFPYIAEPVFAVRRDGGLAVEINPGQTEVSDVVNVRLQAGALAALKQLDAALD
jgi:NAD-dependent deacetylase